MDKNKIIEAAAKLVAKGAYDKAIKEYQKVLDADPKDVRILQKMGELYGKKNDNGQAAFYFTKVAESYATDGFFLKAVALYKQVLKLDPALVDVNLKLAELHQQLQLMSEAMAYYQTVATHYDQKGDTKRSLDTLRKMVDLDPDNVASRIKLAELYAREQMNGEAVGEFRRAAEHLKRNNRTDDYVRVAERITALEPSNLQLARELAEVYLQRSDQKRALAKLQVCFKADPRDLDTLKLLATAFQGLGQTSKTISVFKELAKVYQERGRIADADATWEKIAQLDANDPDYQARKPKPLPVAAPAPARPASAVMPGPPPAAARPAAQQPPAVIAPPPPPAAAPAAAAPRENLAKLLTETDVYVKYGLHDKALDHLRKIFSADPENIDAHEKAFHIYVASNNHAQASEQLLNVLRLHTRRGMVERAQPFLALMLQQSPNHPEVPAFLSVLQTEGTPPAPLEEPADDDAIVVDASDGEIVVSDAPEDALAADVGLQAADDGSVSPEMVADEALAIDGNGPLSNEYDMGPPPVPDEPFPAPVDDEPIAPAAEPEPEAYSLGDEAAELGTGEFEAVGDEVEDSVTQTQAVPLEDASEATPLALGDAPPAPTDRTAAYAKEESVEAPPDEPAAEEIDEATFFVEQGLYDEAREILETVLIAYPGHARATELMAKVEAGGASSEDSTSPSMPAPPPTVTGPETGADGKDAFDLAAELADELGELDEGQEVPSEPVSEDFQYSVEEVFSEFKKGLEKVVKPEDVDTHYDLGIAYKEMGLLDDAVGEFNVARQGCLGQKKEVDCLSMMAQLHLMRGAPAEAVTALQQALGTQFAGGEVEKALRYDLALAYEQSEQLGEALTQYQRVQALDGRYREVSEHVERLAAVVEPVPEAPPRRAQGAPSRKVGYL